MIWNACEQKFEELILMEKMMEQIRDSHQELYLCLTIIEGSLEVKLPTIWTDEKQSREEAERRERLEEIRVEEKE